MNASVCNYTMNTKSASVCRTIRARTHLNIYNQAVAEKEKTRTYSNQSDVSSEKYQSERLRAKKKWKFTFSGAH